MSIFNASGAVATVRDFSDGDLGITITVVEHFDTSSSETLVGTESIDVFIFERQINDTLPSGRPVAIDIDEIEGFELGVDRIDLSDYVGISVSDVNSENLGAFVFGSGENALISLSGEAEIGFGGEGFVIAVESVLLRGVTRDELLAFSTAEEAGFIFDDAIA